MSTDEDKEYDAILVDTSIFDRNGLRLEKGLLGKLNQFKDSNIYYLLPDVIEGEIKSHLEKKVKSSRASLEKAISDADDHLFFDGSELNDARPIVIDDDKIGRVAENRLNKFIANTGALVLECGNYVSITKLLKQYFQSEPPFSETGDKKSEFPDAIVLLATEAWAREKNIQVLAVAGDRDWKNYCEISTHIDFTDDFANALSQFNKATAPFAFLSLLAQAIKSNDSKANIFVNKISNEIRGYFYDFIPEIEANSSHHWEEYCSHGWLTNFELANQDFKIIDHDKDYVVLEVNANFEVRVEGDFSLAHYDSIDRDYVPLKTITRIVDKKFTSEILITVRGDLTGDLAGLEIEEIEVVNPLALVDFGALELNYDEDG